MFSKSRAKMNLTPGERAALRFIETFVWGALLAGFQAASPLLTNPDPSQIAWSSVLHTFLASSLLAVALGVSKYHTAQADPPLPVVPSPLLVPAPAPAPASAVPATAPDPAAGADPAPALPLEASI